MVSSPFQVLLCRAGRGLDVSAPDAPASLASLQSYDTISEESSSSGQPQLHPPPQQRTNRSGSAALGLNSLMLSPPSASPRPGLSHLGGQASLLGLDVICDRVLLPQDDFVLVSNEALYKPGTTSPSATTAAHSSAAASFTDAAALCSFVLAGPTP